LIQPETPPADLGFSMPAEWETHEATWIAWPHNRTDWPGKIVPVYWVYGEIVRKIAPGEIVRILVNSAQHEAQARRILTRAGVDLSRIEFFRFPTDRGWSRDFGPICVRRKGPRPEVAVARFKFTAWGHKYRDYRKDDRIAEKVAKALGLRVFHVLRNAKPVALEGGAIDVNGRGTLLTTQECFLHPTVQVRNPGLTRPDYDEVFKQNLGVTNVLWLKDGIAGDDTHGHVDDLCRFVNPATVVLVQEADPGDVNYRPLRQNRELLEGMRLQDGSRIRIVDLPMPAPLHIDGLRLPASYANFYISNAAVIVPTFNDPADRVALGILGELFPDRQVVGIHAVDLVLGFGTLHCLTQQQPAAGV